MQNDYKEMQNNPKAQKMTKKKHTTTQIDDQKKRWNWSKRDKN